MDWFTLPHTDFNICSDCFLAVFEQTEYRTQFQPILRATDRPISCDFGSSPWYRIAYLLTHKNNQPDLRLFNSVANVAALSKNQPCPGSRKAARNWYAIRDPYKRRIVPNFTACMQCAKTVEALLPNLMGSFVQLDAREPINSVCALHFKPQRQKFVAYFDTFETTADKAIRKNEAPNISALAAEIERLSALGECRQDTPITDAYWHTMQCLPQLTVCASCFDEFVRPKIKSEVLARNFYREPQRLQDETCQLYSPRMRKIFDRACRRNDPKELQDEVVRRKAAEKRIRADLAKLDQQRTGEPADWADQEMDRLISKWREDYE